jgi:hypothetical protein
VARDHFGRLLLVLIAIFVVTGLADSRATRVTVGVLLLTAVGLAVRITGSPSFHWAARLMAWGLLGLVAVLLSTFEGRAARGWAAVCMGLIAVGALAAVLGRVLHHEEVSAQTIAGALCAYLLVGFAFASAYSAADNLGSAQFFGEPVDPDAYSYFSFVTLTTTGYGDLSPVTDLGRRLAPLEAMVGQMYLAVTVARLVALYRPRRARPQPVGDASEAR